MSSPSFRIEARLQKKGLDLIAGVDEAGRGPLAGPVVAAAVLFTSHVKIKGLNDSKQLSSANREKVYLEILSKTPHIGIGIVSEKIIDQINILNASLLAMNNAINQLSVSPDHVLVDGRQKIINFSIPQTTIIRGDSLSCSIAAASVIAKVTRDRIMARLDKIYPDYGFSSHMGYGTKLHVEMLNKKGPLPIHRKTFSYS